MASMKMLMMLVVAAILFCSYHHAVVAREVIVVADDDGNKLEIWPWDIPCYLPWPFPWPRPWPCPPPPRPPPPPPCSPPPSPPRSPPPSPPPPPPPPPPAPATSCSASDKEKVKKCMFNTTSIDACCPTFQSILGTSCPCYQYAEDLDNQVLITLASYCDVDSPCSNVLSPPRPALKSACSTSDKYKVDKCFNKTSIDACCPTFRSILGTSCPCFQYAWEKDNLKVITAESYCDFDSPCMGGKSPPRPALKSACSTSDKYKVDKCFNKTSIDACCPIFQSILGTSCPCFQYAWEKDNQKVITAESYCDFDSPCMGGKSPPRPALKSACSTSDKDKVDKCFNKTSIDACCPTFRSILGTSCPCFQYAWEKDNLKVITAESYCDFDSPCMGGKSPPRPALKSACSTSDKYKVDKCFNKTSIDACCPIFQSILGTSCPCFQYAWEKDNLKVITAESYCDFDSPCMGGKSPPRPALKSACSTSDKDKVDKCFNKTSIDACCPTFRSILGTSCPCFQYAWEKDNLKVITAESYCDFDSPCMGGKSPPRPALKSACSTSDKYKVDKCFNKTSIDACCPTFRSILGTSCPCFQYAWEKDNLKVITAESYCDFDSPCMGGKSPPRPALKSACSTSDKYKVDKCFNKTSIDACCPTFRSILGTSCPCFQYAWEKDNLKVITAESYCDFDSPCMGGKVIKLSKEE